MKKPTSFLAITLSILALSACSDQGDKADAYGNFEALETIVAAEASGKILRMDFEEGMELSPGATVALVDTTMIALQREQLLAQKQAVASKMANFEAQIQIQQQQKENLLVEQQRVKKMLYDGASTQQKLDQLNGQIALIDKTITSINVQKTLINNELSVFDKQLGLLNQQFENCFVKNPQAGTVLEKYVNKNEIIAQGKPIYKIADISQMELRVYVDGAQLPNVKINQDVTVKIDKNDEEWTQMSGKVSWISSVAEFTPKIIQTKAERVNLVYAVKVLVNNDGSLKIGMPGEVVFSKNETTQK